MLESLLPSYDALYVVSDLHLGGFAGNFNGRHRDYRIFRESAALAALVDELSEDPRRICLVLNGDIVDFLAEEDAKYFDWEHALRKLQRIMGDEQQAQVWRALRSYIAKEKDLVLVLGNHDVELALPEPQLHLTNFLTDGVPARRAFLQFSMDGTGFGCKIGRSRVLCLHGNEADPWNAIDYGRLGLIRRALARNSVVRNQAALTDWIPNAGTQMVIEYMNGVKRQHQWIDLLKPEEEAAGMVTAALVQSPRLWTFLDVNKRRQEAAKKLSDGWLGGPATAAVVAPAADAFISPLPEDADSLLKAAAEQLAMEVEPAELVMQQDADFLMGTPELVRRSAHLKLRPGALRDTLRATLAGNQAFAHDVEDSTFNELDELCGPDIDFIVAGHTHLHRALKRKRTGGYYFNSGTWIQLLHLPEQALADQTFPALEALLERGDLAELEKGVNGLSLLKTRRTVVSIERSADGTARGRLSTFERAGNGWRLEPVPGSSLPEQAP